MLSLFRRLARPMAMSRPRPSPERDVREKKRPRRRAAIEPYSHDDVLWHDVRALLGAETVHSAEQRATDWDAPFHFREEIEVVVDRLSAHGNALARGPAPRSAWVIVAPFALPGERVRVRVYRSARLHSFADLVAVVAPNPELRDDRRVQCKYFGKCSGCQYQVRHPLSIDLCSSRPRCSPMTRSSRSNATSSSRHTRTFHPCPHPQCRPPCPPSAPRSNTTTAQK